MNTIKIMILSMFVASQIVAQQPNDIYGIVRKNYFSMVPSPFDSTFLIQQFDSATIRMGTVNMATGYVSNTGNSTYAEPINLTGAALNPYTNSYICMGYNKINTWDLTTGVKTNSAVVSNPIAASYFDNFRFNNSDSTMYGLARRSMFDTITNTINGELYLAKINTTTGVISQISSASVGQGYAPLGGSTINPYQMIYYFSTGSSIMGLDMYNGNIYSNAPFVISDGIAFDNYAYSCADTTIYGLIRQNYFSYVPDPLIPNDSIQVIDSSTVKLGKINPNTGVVTTISPISLHQGGYTLNGGCTIDPLTMVYYYNRGDAIVGVSLATGLAVSNQTLTYQDGTYFDLMRNFHNCISASKVRQNIVSENSSIEVESNITIFPNPTSKSIVITTKEKMNNIKITSLTGGIILNKIANAYQAALDISSLNKGIYFITLTLDNKKIVTRKIVKED